MNKELPSKELLRELFDYVDGNLIHKLNSPKGKKGNIVGWVEKNKYRSTNVKGVRYRVHRLIFQFHYGFCPEFLDHIDTNRQNNRIENLRAASYQQNNINKSATRKNIVGLKGVCMERGKYKANIKRNGRSYHLGYFDTAKEASDAFDKKSIELSGNFAWTNSNSNMNVSVESGSNDTN